MVASEIVLAEAVVYHHTHVDGIGDDPERHRQVEHAFV